MIFVGVSVRLVVLSARITANTKTPDVSVSESLTIDRVRPCEKLYLQTLSSRQGDRGSTHHGIFEVLMDLTQDLRAVFLFANMQLGALAGLIRVVDRWDCHLASATIFRVNHVSSLTHQ